MKAILAAVLTVSGALAAQAQTGGTWSEPAGVPHKVGAGGGVAATGPSTFFVLAGGGSDGLFRHDVGAAQPWTHFAVPETVSTGGAIAARPGTTQLYVLAGAGGSKRGFHRYDTAAGTWAVMESFPIDTSIGVSLAATASKVYALGGSGSGGRTFYEFTPDAGDGSWALKAALLPAAVGAGAALVAPDPAGDLLYAVRGANSRDFWSYAIATDGWTPLPSVPSILGLSTGSAMAAGPAGSLYVLGYRNGSYVELNRYDVALSTWSLPLAMTPEDSFPALPGAGAGLVALPGSDLVHVIRGGNSNHVWRYSRSQDRFLAALAPLPSHAGAAGSLIPVETGEAATSGLYALASDATVGVSGFYRYSIPLNRWTTLTHPCQDYVYEGEVYQADVPIGAGAAIAWDGGAYIYANPGSSGIVFLRYSIAADRWEEKAMGPMWSSGARMISASDGNLYVNFPNNPGFQRYLPAEDRWEVRKACGEWFGGGASLAAPSGRDVIYALPGGGLPSAWTFFLGGNTWSPGPSVLPVPVTAGAALVHSSATDTLYALSGSGAAASDNGRFWSCSIEEGGVEWIEQAPPPGSIGPGTALACPRGGSIYALLGSNSRTLCRYALDVPAPAAPTGLSQWGANGSPVAAGSVVRKADMTFKAAAVDPKGRRIQLQVQVVAVGASFDDLTVSATGELVASGAAAQVRMADIGAGGRRWKLRAVNEAGAASAWVEYGANGPDFVVEADQAPDAGGAGQFRATNGTAVPQGGSASGGAIRLGGPASDPDHDAVRYLFEVRKVGESYTGRETSSSSYAADGAMAFGDEALEVGSYRWRCCAESEWGARSAWIDFGTNDPEAADFTILPYGSTNSVAACGLRAPGGAAGLLPLLLLLLRCRGFRG